MRVAATKQINFTGSATFQKTTLLNALLPGRAPRRAGPGSGQDLWRPLRRGRRPDRLQGAARGPDAQARSSRSTPPTRPTPAGSPARRHLRLRDERRLHRGDPAARLHRRPRRPEDIGKVSLRLNANNLFSEKYYAAVPVLGHLHQPKCGSNRRVHRRLQMVTAPMTGVTIEAGGAGSGGEQCK